MYGKKIHRKRIIKKNNYIGEGGGGTRYIGKVLIRKSTLRKRDYKEKRLHGERIYMERKHSWKGDYMGRKLHRGVIIQGGDYIEREKNEQGGDNMEEKNIGGDYMREETIQRKGTTQRERTEQGENNMRKGTIQGRNYIERRF